MPLEHKSSEKAFKHNLKAEMHAGKSLPQSLAIAYAVKRRGKKMAKGGKIDEREHERAVEEVGRHEGLKGVHTERGAYGNPYGAPTASSAAREEHKRTLREMPNPKLKGLADGGEARPTGSSGARPDPNPGQYDQTLANGIRNIKNALGYAEGGRIEGNYQNPSAHEQVRFREVYPEESGYQEPPSGAEKCNYSAEEQDDRELNQHGSHERGPYGAYAHGGFITDNYQSRNPGEDMVGRIMKKREQCYSEGGRVANDTGSPYDDLVNRDYLEYDYDPESAGEEEGNEYDANHDDLVARIMLKRRKQHNPSPA